jgi:hypothetical protein
MKTFKEFLEEMIAVNNIANSGAEHIAKYDPIMKFKMFRRKPKHKKGKK